MYRDNSKVKGNVIDILRLKGEHGGPEDGEGDRHLGDLGNIESKGGTATIDKDFDHIKLYGPASIIGRGFVIYDKEDNLGNCKACSRQKAK